MGRGLEEGAGVFLGVVETIVGSVALMWVLFIVFPIFCITSFGDCTCP